MLHTYSLPADHIISFSNATMRRSWTAETRQCRTDTDDDDDDDNLCNPYGTQIVDYPNGTLINIQFSQHSCCLRKKGAADSMNIIIMMWWTMMDGELIESPFAIRFSLLAMGKRDSIKYSYYHK